MAHYIPLTWLSFAVDYRVWNLNPFGYHLTSVALHACNGVLVYQVVSILLADGARPLASADPPGRLRAASALAALFFALHPLRVESVAWVTERRDVLSGLFFLLTLLCYLQASVASRPAQATSWRAASVAMYAFCLLSKETGVALPLLLLVVDFCRSRRLAVGLSFGTRTTWRGCLLDKVPYFVLAVPVAAVVLFGQTQHIASWSVFDLRMRSAVMCHSILIYLWKTIWPANLSPLYPLPDLRSLYRWPYPGYEILTALITVLLMKDHRRSPAILAAWAWYLIALFPVSGFFQSGGQLMADRYSYIPSLGWAALIGGCFLAGMRRFDTSRLRACGMGVGAFALLFVMGMMTRRQIAIWHDSYTLWDHALRLNPGSTSARNNMGAAMAERGQLQQAVAQFRLVLQEDPGHQGAQSNLRKALDLMKSQGARSGPGE
jgi:hypothetical protein